MSLPERIQQDLDRQGYALPHWSKWIEAELVNEALRRFNLEIRKRGLTVEQIDEWREVGFWPDLRYSIPVYTILLRLANLLDLDHTNFADPQIVVQFPDEADEWPLVPHVDEPPPWAEGRQYKLIIGVPLTDVGNFEGGLAVWPFTSANKPKFVTEGMKAGQLILMHPKLPHSSTLNRGPRIRYALYFRVLEEKRTE